MMAPEIADATEAPCADVNELRSAFRQMCVEYEDVVDEAAEVTPPVDERIGLALFKIDEATAVTEALRQDAVASHDSLMDALLENCRELEDIFIRVNLVESFVAKVQAASKELETRMDTIAKASDPIFNTGGVTTLLRSLSIKRPTAESTVAPATTWDPLDLSLNATQLIERLDRSSAEQLRVSAISSTRMESSQLHKQMNMEVTWHNDVDLLEGTGRVTHEGEALLRQALYDERLAVVTLLGSRATATARRRLVAKLLDQAAPAPVTPGPGAGVALLANVIYLEEDYQLIILDVGDPSSPAIGPLCALSSLVLCAGDTETAAQNALPAFPPFQETLQALERELSAIEIFDMLPTMLTLDFSRAQDLQQLTMRDPRGLLVASSLANMARLKTLDMRAAEEVAVMDAEAFFSPNVRVKRIFGADLTGEAMLSLCQSLSRDAAEGNDPDLYSAWDEYVERKCTSIAEDATSTYVDCIQSSLGYESAPIELEAFEKLHDELWRLAMDVFRNGVASLNAPSRRVVRTKLKSDLKKKHADELARLHINSRKFCEDLRAEIWQGLVGPLLQSVAAADQAGGACQTQSFRAALEAIHQFDGAFMERARGPESVAVLSEFYRSEAVDLFRRLEDIVSQRMTDTHLRELREQLEKDFEAKKSSLIDRFKQEEAQLRAALDREKEMMQKIHKVQNARVKIDESEFKRLNDELGELRSAKAALESRQVVLEHTNKSVTQKKSALEAKVRDLEHAVRQEMGSRAELVDTLAATIRASEEKEQQLLDRIAELHVEVKDKSSRIENKLRELSVQQRKTSEEKDELQKKLNDFFLRVSSLPPALQQNLFCGDSADGRPVGFADALSSYMSE